MDSEAEDRIEQALRDGASTLNLARLGLHALPEAVKDLTNLTRLDLEYNHLTALPEWLGNLTNLAELDLARNRLTALPESVGNLTRLTHLDLEDNRVFEAIPESVANLSNLTVLDVSSNKITAAPEWLGSLIKLTELDLAYNQLTALPEWIGNLTNLTKLILWSNNLGVVPESIGNLTRLTELFLSRTELTAVPDSLGNLTALTRLFLENNRLTALPESLVKLTALTELQLADNQLTALPDSIGNLDKLTVLDVRSNQLTVLPSSIGRLEKLTRLDLAHNRLTALPASVGNLTNVVHLQVANNKLTTLPESLGRLSKLFHLNLAENQLTVLPDTIGNLSDLDQLQLTGNELATLPESVGNLTNLTQLGVGNNKLTALPESAGRLTKLTQLNAADNQLTAIPESLKNLTTLTQLNLYGNKLAAIPEPIPIELGTQVWGDPTQYQYAHAERLDLTRPPDQSIELTLRSMTGVTAGPIPQEALDGIDGLRLDLYRPVDLTPLARLHNLEWLSIHSTVPIDVVELAATIAPATSLRDLSIEAPITDIAPLAALTSLTRLTLDNTQLTDISPIASLTRLDDLSICDGPLADLTPLAGLRLGRLFVYRTQVADLSPLAGMPTLQVLGLAGCPVRDLSVVTTLPVLHFVSLRATPITDLGDLPARIPRITFEGVGEPASWTRGDGQTINPPTTPDPGNRPRAADLLAEFRATHDFSQRRKLLPMLLATRDREAVQEVIREKADGSRALRGLFFRDGVGDIPFAANPWGIPADAGLSGALTHVWASIADLAPRLIATIRNRTLGLALLTDDTGAPSLGYLTWCRNDDEPGPIDELITLDQLADPDHDSYLTLVIGTAPRVVDPTAIVPLLAGPVPRPIRDFWAVHHSFGPRFGGIMGNLDCNTLGRFKNDSWDDVAERLDGLPPDRFVHGVGSNNFQAYVLDLDVLDGAGNPTVVCWAFKEWGVGGHKQFWDWLDSDGVELAF